MSLYSIRSSSRGARGRRMMADINVVPYIDVMLVLLVIFMVTAPLIAPSVRKRSGRGSLEQTMSKAELSLFLRAEQQAAPSLPVVIAADKNIPYQNVMNVMADLKAQGIQKIGLLVQSR